MLDAHRLRAVVTTRAGGMSSGPYASLNLGLHVGDDECSVIENRRRAAATVGAGLDDLVFAAQVHGRDVAVVGGGDRGRGSRNVGDGIAGVDGLVTTTAEVALVIVVADCVPIVLFHPRGILACVHAGWRGTVGRVVEAALETMVGLGAGVGGVLAAVGPAVSASRYEVGDEVADAARACFGGDAGDVLASDAGGRVRFDLQAANRRILLESGVEAANIVLAPIPTGEGTFYSHRVANPCGRFAALARLAG